MRARRVDTPECTTSLKWGRLYVYMGAARGLLVLAAVGELGELGPLGGRLLAPGFVRVQLSTTTAASEAVRLDLGLARGCIRLALGIGLRLARLVCGGLSSQRGRIALDAERFV